jgi:hypothetical protein
MSRTDARLATSAARPLLKAFAAAEARSRRRGSFTFSMDKCQAINRVLEFARDGGSHDF